MLWGVPALHADYVDWCLYHVMDIPCSLAQFREWLGIQEFRIDKAGVVYGLVLRADLLSTIH